MRSFVGTCRKRIVELSFVCLLLGESNQILPETQYKSFKTQQPDVHDPPPQYIYIYIFPLCLFVRGIILVGNASYGLEPVPQSSANEHLLFALKDSPSQPFVCGLTDGMDEVLVPYSPDLSKLLRQKRTLPQTRYVEAVFVVDSLRFNLTKRNSTAVRMQMVELANLLDGYYKPLNVRIVLVGLVTFDTGNPFSVQGSAGDVLGRFASWRSKVLLAQKKNDLSQGLPGPYPGGVLGMAFVGSVCSASTAAGISVFSDNTVSYYSTIIAHEIGHNLGMIHDSAACKCQEKQCIMEAMSTGATQFSDCSSNGFENFILGGGGVCLRNQPTASDVVTVAQCGNGLLEMGEECDCGTPQECKNRCCDAATCRLTPGSACAQGSCCSNCQLQVSGTVCRQSVNQCDLAEYCNGTSSFCPSDFYLMDGLPCAGNTAYCYEGRCQTYDYQCSNLFGSGAMKADDMCFKYVNTIGDRFGNCGYSNSNPLPCSVANVMCGKIQCTNFDSNNPPNGVSISVVTIGNGTVCKNADYNLGSDVLDPAYVKTGSMCAVGKVCINFQCVNSSALHGNATCDAKINCSSNGVCNNMGHCHCNDGWAPLNCDRAGRGGSIDSGPAQIGLSYLWITLIQNHIATTSNGMQFKVRREEHSWYMLCGKHTTAQPPPVHIGPSYHPHGVCVCSNGQTHAHLWPAGGHCMGMQNAQRWRRRPCCWVVALLRSPPRLLMYWPVSW
uniref:Disintegrin and metalloproteinase domain-containing protein 9-like n=1 Tax=Denticeps clupeoides TaxID=299321 RepID=A0AAY4CH17_9TELE